MLASDSFDLGIVNACYHRFVIDAQELRRHVSDRMGIVSIEAISEVAGDDVFG